ncbi:MAG: DUF7619 domain-containing protein [Lewinella sp.]|uniref:DUF7619 domain-containing protein n=1 Tax=Lewinella sp. TaxID=2004506 RepID=UPI003D6BE9B2
MRTLLSTLLILLGVNLVAQATWTNHINDHIIEDIALEGDFFWTATQGGLVKMNIETNEKEFIRAANSGYRGGSPKEIEITEDGTKWIGGQNSGLFRWDGENSWENFYFINTGDTLIEIDKLKLDPNGNPWFLSVSNGTCWGCPKLISYDGSEFSNHQANLQLPIDRGVKDFAFIDENELWVAAYNDIIRYDGNEMLMTYSPTAIGLVQDESIRRIEVDNQGVLWVSTENYTTGYDRLIKFDGNQWLIEDGNAPGYVTSFFKDINGELWANFFGGATESNSYGTHNGTAWQYYTTNTLDIPIWYGTPVLYAVDSANSLWFHAFSGMQAPKVFNADGTSITAYDTQLTPLASNLNDAMVIDCDNNIWLAGYDLSRFDGENWELFYREETGFESSVRQAVIDPQTCGVWFALWSNGPDEPEVGYYDGSDFTTFDIGSTSARCIDVSTSSTLYVGTHTMGLAVREDDQWTFFNEGNSPLNNHVRSVKMHSNGALWVGSRDEGLARWENGEWTIFDASNSPVTANCYWIYEDSEQNLWVSADGGLAKYDGTEWEFLALDPSFFGVTGMKEDVDGHFWLSVTYGVVYWNGYSTSFYNIENTGMTSSYIREIVIDPATNDVWFLHLYGASVLENYQNGNNISGLVFIDRNENGVFESSEDVRLPGQEVLLLPDNTSAITNSLGAYSFYPTQSGDYEITSTPIAPLTPVTATSLNIAYANESIAEQDFAVYAEELPERVSIDVVAGQLVCNEEGSIWVTFRNEALLPANGDVTLTFPANFTFVETMPEASSVTDTEVTWSFSNLGSLESRVFRLQLVAPGVEELNETYSFTGNIISGEQNLSSSDERILLCSFDPNDKTCTAVGESSANYSLLGEALQYTIRFQNMGNYRAKDVVIRDFIDPSLDISSLQVLSSSHLMTTTINSDREAVFRFMDINLPPEMEDVTGSQGFIKYQINPLAELPDPTPIHNTAHIYFDLNPAIITNTTENILVEDLSVDTDEPVETLQVRVYPNPSRTGFWLDWQDANQQENWEAEVFDLAGRIVLRYKGSSLREQITISRPGLYLLRMRKGEHWVTRKIVVME